MNDRREIFGWAMYDWANSGFQTTVITVLSGPYLTALARSAVGENGLIFRLGPLDVTAKSLFPYSIGLSVFLSIFLLPWLGAIVDFTSLKKQLLAVLCAIGSAASCLMWFVAGSRYLLGAVLLVVANLSFGASLVLYNAFLNDIASDDRRDRVSSYGYALGYLGGGLLLAANLAMLQSADRLGISSGTAVRLSLVSAGVWWGGFGFFALQRLKNRQPPRPLRAGESYMKAGLEQLGRAWAELRRLSHLKRYLASYMLFNDGIQTVISMTSLFLSQELFVARGLPEDQSFLVGLILFVQFVAFFGAWAFERLAAWMGAKRAILVSLVIWSAVIIYAYGWLRTTAQAWAIGAVIALVLGGSQALSRSLFSKMIPAGHEAAFFGVYEISERGTSWIGPLLFGYVAAATNSYRQAMLSLIVLFVAGMVGLSLTNVREATAATSLVDASRGGS